MSLLAKALKPKVIVNVHKDYPRLEEISAELKKLRFWDAFPRTIEYIRILRNGLKGRKNSDEYRLAEEMFGEFFTTNFTQKGKLFCSWEIFVPMACNKIELLVETGPKPFFGNYFLKIEADTDVMPAVIKTLFAEFPPMGKKAKYMQPPTYSHFFWAYL